MVFHRLFWSSRSGQKQKIFGQVFVFSAMALMSLAIPAKQTSPQRDIELIRISTRRLANRPISAMQQGQFIEILCGLIPSVIAQQVASTSFEDAPPCRVSYKGQVDQPPRPWYPDGAVEVAQYSFDTNDPYNGSRSEKIEITGKNARAGISQDGFYLRQGKTYKLRLHMRSDRGVLVRASLHGGGGMIAGPTSLGRAGKYWTSAEVDLRATRTIENATLTIDFQGPGVLWLDRVYLIGSDAVLGIWRPDVVAALKAMHPGVIRFGGSTIENYEWQKGVGSWDERQPFTTVWGGLEENFVGIDEFVQLCRYVGAEPLLCVRWTGKKPEDAAAEVEYCNGPRSTHWGALRAKNGHAEPYGVKYWQIGNEVSSPEYDATAAAFAAAMRKADPTIKVISSFPTPSLLEAAGTQFDYLAPHHYEIDDLTHEEQSLIDMQDWIKRAAAGRDIRVAVTEWNTTGGDFGLKRGILQTLGNALSVSRYLNLLQRHADLVEIANRSNLADSFGSGFLITGPGWIYKSPAFYAQEMYARAAGSYALTLKRSESKPLLQQDLDLSATLSPDDAVLRIYSVNSTSHSITTRFHLTDFPTKVKEATAYTLEDREHGLTSEVMNSRDDPVRVSLKSRRELVLGREFDYTFQPISVTLLELSLGLVIH